MRTAAFEPSKAQIVHEEQARDENEQKIEALKRYGNVLKNIGEELMVSGSDDFQLILWNPSKGQLISKCPYENQFHLKYQRNHFWISALNFFVASLGLPRSFLGLPVGFLIYDITY